MNHYCKWFYCLGVLSGLPLFAHSPTEDRVINIIQWNHWKTESLEKKRPLSKRAFLLGTFLLVAHVHPARKRSFVTKYSILQFRQGQGFSLIGA